MDSRVTMALAGVLLLGAVFAGYWGVALSRQPQGEAPARPVNTPISEAVESGSEALRAPVVVAARDLEPYQPVRREDLAVERLRIAPAGSFSSIDQVEGRLPWNPVAAGTWLSQSSFANGGPLAQMIRPQERALAIAVDEVVGAGGHLRPGDYVDVLLYMRDETAGRTQSAQVVVPAVRVLSFGETLGPDSAGQALETKGEKKEERRNAPRHAVLAVPRQWLTRLMLASQAGSLRLAVRSSEERLHQRYQDGEVTLAPLDEPTRNLVPLDHLATRRAPVTASAPAPRAAPSGRVEIVRGAEHSWQTP